jgi:hypothetical protein
VAEWKVDHSAKQAFRQRTAAADRHFSQQVSSISLEAWKARRKRRNNLRQRETHTRTTIAHQIIRTIFGSWRDAWADHVATSCHGRRQLRRAWSALARLRTALQKAHAKSYILGRQRCGKCVLSCLKRHPNCS